MGLKIFGKEIRFGIPGIPPRFGANLTGSKWFQTQARKAFDEVDIDRDGA